MSATARAICLLLISLALIIASAIASCSSDETGDAGLSDAGNALTCDGKKTCDPCTGGLCYVRGYDAGNVCLPYCATEGGVCQIDGINSRCMPLLDGGFWWAPVVSDMAYSCDDVPYDPCSSEQQNGCHPGQECLTLEGAMTCFVICVDASACKTNEECIDTQLGFKVCLAPAAE